MKSFQCFKVASFCFLLIFIVYVIKFTKENLKFYDTTSEFTNRSYEDQNSDNDKNNLISSDEIIDKPTKLLNETSLPTNILK